MNQINKMLEIAKLRSELKAAQAELTKEREANTLRNAIQVWSRDKIKDSELKDSSNPWERGYRSALRDLMFELADGGSLSRKAILEGNEPNEGA